MNLTAKPVLKNKFWIVENGEDKIATIQAIKGSTNVVLVKDGARERFPSVSVLKKKHNIRFEAGTETKETPKCDVVGYPSDVPPYRSVFDREQRLPIYTKSEKSKSQYCAGHYLIQFKNNWVKDFCPKLLTLSRNPYKGPFKSLQEAKDFLAKIK